MKTKIERIMFCKACSKAYASNKKKKCCGADLVETGTMEKMVSMSEDAQTKNTN